MNHSASNKRHRFKRSMRLRLSETSMNLSLEGVSSYSPSTTVDQSGGSEGSHKVNANPQRRVHAGAGVLRRTPAVSPGSADEEDMMSAFVPQVGVNLHLPVLCICYYNVNFWDEPAHTQKRWDHMEKCSFKYSRYVYSSADSMEPVYFIVLLISLILFFNLRFHS